MRARRQALMPRAVENVEVAELVPAARDELSNTGSLSDEEDVLESAAYGECSLEEMMAMPSVLQRGTLSKESKKGSVLFACSVAPRFIRSNYETRISYVSRLFRFWRGDLTFRIRVTKSLYQEAKFLMVFVPGATPAALRSMSVESLISSQCSVVFAADNSSIVELLVPFISTGNWLRTNESSGAFGLLLADPLVSSNEFGGTINYTLECYSGGPDCLVFRYAMLPQMKALPDTDVPGDGGGSVRPPNDPDDPNSQPQVLLPNTYRRSSRQAPRAAYSMNEGWGLTESLHATSSVAPCVGTIHSCLPVAFPTAGRTTTVLAHKLSTLDVSPPFSFVSTTGIMSLTLVPYLPKTWRFFGTFASSADIARPDSYARSYWFSNFEGQGDSVDSSPAMSGASWKHATPEWTVLLPSPELAQKFVDLQWGVLMIVTRGAIDTVVRFVADSRHDDWLHLKYDWKSDYDKSSLLGIAYDSPIFWVDSPVSVMRWSSASTKPVEEKWQQLLIQVAPRAVYPNFNLYSTAWKDNADPILTWLNSSDDTPAPIEATGKIYALSASQSPRYFDMIEEVERGVFTWLFNVFSGNSDSPWAKVARVADAIFEFCLPLLVGYDGLSNPIDVSAGWELEYEGLREDEQRRLPNPGGLIDLRRLTPPLPPGGILVENAVVSQVAKLASRVRPEDVRRKGKSRSRGRSRHSRG